MGSTFSIGQKKKAAPAPDIPSISRFVQNADGSITGRVTNSKTFRNGTEITTSPVKKGAKAGMVVTTLSGSKYLLKQKPSDAVRQSNIFSIDESKKLAAALDIPSISTFVQNANGSITGSVTNSRSFPDGTEITTSPVRESAKAGMIVTTLSGSKYLLYS